DWAAAATHGHAAGLAAFHKSAPAEAIVELKSALDAARRLGGTVDAVAREIDIRLDLHNVYRFAGDVDAARDQLDQALADARRIGDEARVQRTLVQLAAHALYATDDLATVAFCQQALAAPGLADDIATRARVNYLLGVAYVGLGRLHDAVTVLTENVRLLAGPLRGERFGAPTFPYVTSVGWLAIAHADLGEFE